MTGQSSPLPMFHKRAIDTARATVDHARDASMTAGDLMAEIDLLHSDSQPDKNGEASMNTAKCGKHKVWRDGRCAEMSCWNYVQKHAVTATEKQS